VKLSSADLRILLRIKREALQESCECFSRSVRVRRSLSAHWTEPACTPVATDRARIDRQIREFGDAAGALGVDAYLARLKALREQRDAHTEQAVSGLSGHRAVEWLRALGETVQRADVRDEKANLLHASYERIVVAGPEIIRVSLTSAAYARGLALALPEKVVMARPTGVGRSTRGPEARESSGAKRRQVSNGHTYQLFVFEGCPPGIDAAGR